jgi:hypothetical protein
MRMRMRPTSSSSSPSELSLSRGKCVLEYRPEANKGTFLHLQFLLNSNYHSYSSLLECSTLSF